MTDIEENTMSAIETLLQEVKSLRSELADLRTGLEASKIRLNRDSIYNNKEIRLILGVDDRLIKKYRDNGLLSYHRQDDKYWYTGTDIIEFLKGSRYHAFA